MKISTMNPKSLSNYVRELTSRPPRRERPVVQLELSTRGIKDITGALLEVICRCNEEVYGRFLTLSDSLQKHGVTELPLGDAEIETLMGRLERGEIVEAAEAICAAKRAPAAPPIVTPPPPVIPTPIVAVLSDSLTDFAAEESAAFQRLIDQKDTTVDKLFHAVDHAAEHLEEMGYCVAIYRRVEVDGETMLHLTHATIKHGESQFDKPTKPDPSTSTVGWIFHHGRSNYPYIVDINKPETFLRQGLPYFPIRAARDQALTQGPGTTMFVLICSRYGVEAVVQVNARRMAGEVLTEKQKEIAALLADENRGRGRLIWLKNYFVGEVITAIVTVREKHQLAVVNKDIQQLPAVKHHSRAFFVVVGSLVGLKKGALFLIKLVSKAIRSIAGFFSSDKTELIEFFNRRGQIIKAYLDYPQGNKPMGKNIWVVIPPAFGKTKETSFLLALFLRANGIGVVRFDDSDSNGESAGRIYDLTLSNSTNNILDAVQYLQMRFNPSNIGVIPFSLSARTAMKAVAQDPRGSFLLPIVGAPNLESLLEGVYGENLVAEYREGRREGPINMLGHIINSGNFLGDAAKNGFADLASAQADMARISCPVVWFCGEQDPWVKPEEVIEVLGNKPDRRVVTFAGLQHRVREAGRAPELFAEVVRNVISITTGIDSDKVVLREPSASEIVERATTEKGRLEVRLTKEETIRQWDEYLKGFGVLLQTTDYMDYLDLLCEQIDFTPGERLIDIGGGHGNLTTLLLNRLSFDVEVRGWQKSEVTGVDFVETAVTKAREGVREALNRRQDLPSINFQRVDMETDPLPHESNYYDTAVASLFLSYVHNPAEVVRKICRSVKPGGIIILTSLKPDADVSQIFHRFLEKVRAMEPSPERERLLSQGRELFNSAMGWIENEEERGQFKYFSAGELKNLLKANDCEIEEITYSFGEQAVVVVGRMRK